MPPDGWTPERYAAWREQRLSEIFAGADNEALADMLDEMLDAPYAKPEHERAIRAAAQQLRLLTFASSERLYVWWNIVRGILGGWGLLALLGTAALLYVRFH